MIKVEVTYTNDKISKLKISGHAEYLPIGEDIVCAGVSAIATGLLNALYEMTPNTCDLSLDESGLVSVKVNDLNNLNVQIILNVGLIQLNGIIDSYPENIKLISK